MMLEKPVLLYDHACGRCRKFAALVRALNWGGRIEVADLDGSRAEELLPHLSRWERLSTLRFLTPGGGHFTASAATAELFAHLPLTGLAWRSARRVFPRLRHGVSYLYDRVAQARSCNKV